MSVLGAILGAVEKVNFWKNQDWIRLENVH